MIEQDLISKLQKVFPGLAGAAFRVTSPADHRYNCIAWVARHQNTWWWPDQQEVSYWPDGVHRQETLTAFMDAFAQLGYTPCDDSNLEAAWDKIAVFARDTLPTHAPRQLPNGRWTSKLGESVDIEHDLGALCGSLYGQIACVMRRPRQRIQPPERSVPQAT